MAFQLAARIVLLAILCDRAAACTSAELACAAENRCIPIGWRCDGDTDCVDGSDEIDCMSASVEPFDESGEAEKTMCAANEFLCVGKKNCVDCAGSISYCIPRAWLCDGEADCVDRSDEAVCTSPYTCSPDTYFKCANTPACIPPSWKCDGTSDCTDSSDEADCPNNNSSLVNAEIDACLTAGCSQTCEQIEERARCGCHTGYRLQRDGTTCLARGRAPLLLLAVRRGIRIIDPATGHHSVIAEQLASAVGLDYIYKRNSFVWSDVSAEKISVCELDVQARLNSSELCRNEQVLAEERVESVDGLAVDWVHDLIYWTDTDVKLVSVMGLGDAQPRYRKTLFSDRVDLPRAIAVDPGRGLLFWTDWGAAPKIERATSDGAQRQAIVDDGLAWPNGLAIDMLAERIYWADAKLKHIMMADYDGAHRRMIHSGSRHEQIFSLALFEDSLYWTDWNSESVNVANKLTGGERRTIVKRLRGPMTVRVYHPMAQPSLPNKCANHSCGQLCLPSADARFDPSSAANSTFTCHCADHFRLDPISGTDCLPIVDQSLNVTQAAGNATDHRANVTATMDGDLGDEANGIVDDEVTRLL